jgi:sugar/nucleoside kinase (ribokinase family)
MDNIDIISLGQIVADIIVKPVGQFPEVGRADIVEKIELRCGGCALNTAIILNKLGLKAGVIGKVGDDMFGNFLISQINKFELNTRGVKRESSINTSSAIVMISSGGERSFLYSPGGNEELSFNDIDFDLIVRSKILHIGGIMKLVQLKPAKVLRKAKELGITTSMDTDWDVQGKWIDLIESSLPHTDIFISSIDEARLISKKETPYEISQFFLSYGIKIAVLKMGEDGCYVKTQDEMLTLPVFKVDVVDTTGAGDAFAAGFLAGYHKGWSIEKAGRLANACGALCATEIGTTDGIKTLQETLRFMKK